MALHATMWRNKTEHNIKILVPTGDQDPTVHFTQSFWMAVAPPILVANQIWTYIVKPWETSINPVLFFKIALHLKKNDDSPFTSVRFFCFWRCSSFEPIFSGASAVELVLELRKYHFWRNFWRMKFDEWLTYDSWFIFRIYHGEEQTETQIRQGTSAISKQ